MSNFLPSSLLCSWHLLLLVVVVLFPSSPQSLLVSASNKNKNNNNNNKYDHLVATTTAPHSATTPGEEFFETQMTFVESPAATDTTGITIPIKIILWSTPNRDWDNSLVHRLKGLVTRFDAHLVKFHPHEVINDGSVEPYHCRNANDDGHIDITTLPETCLTDCINAGRYCSIDYPDMDRNQDAQAHMGLTGADLVMESMRRLCVWIVYGRRETILTYWNYLQALRETRCDMSLNDNCLDRVYKQVGIDSKQITDCFHNAGGAGTQVDLRNNILQEEMHKSQQLLNAFNSTDIPHLVINNQPIYQANNISMTSDWQLLALTCDAFNKSPKPKICDFCLMECPKGNPNHDPTRQCLWDLTCGDDRTFDDWMNGVGAFAASNTTTTTTTTAPGGDDNAVANQQDNTPTMAPTQGDEEKEDEKEEEEGAPAELYVGILPQMYSDNSTDVNITTANGTEHVVVPPQQHHNNNNNHHPSSSSSHHTTTLAPSIAAATDHAPTSAPVYAGGTGYSQPKTNPPHFGGGGGGGNYANTNSSGSPHHNGGGGDSSSSSSSSSSGGTLASPHKSSTAGTNKPTNTANAASAFGGVLIGALILGGVIGSLVVYKKWKFGKEYENVINSAERAEGGLATTASHATTDDLQLHVEMSSRGSNKANGNGYYAPPSGSNGTWS